MILLQGSLILKCAIQRVEIVTKSRLKNVLGVVTLVYFASASSPVVEMTLRKIFSVLIGEIANTTRNATARR